MSLLTSNPDAPPPAVGPPVYGQLAVGATATAANLETVAPPWVRDANLDPRLRVAAGLGGEVVRQNQDRYVEEAWRQVGDVLGANALRRRGEFSLAASATLHRKWISQLSAVDLVTSTAPVHARVFVGAEPHDHRAASSVAAAAVDRLGRVPAGHARARQPAGCGGVARGGRSGGSGVAVGGAQPLKVAVAARHDRRARGAQPVWGVAAAPSILARLVPGLDQTGMTAAQAATQLDSLSQLAGGRLRHRRPGRGARGIDRRRRAC